MSEVVFDRPLSGLAADPMVSKIGSYLEAATMPSALLYGKLTFAPRLFWPDAEFDTIDVMQVLKDATRRLADVDPVAAEYLERAAKQLYGIQLLSCSGSLLRCLACVLEDLKRRNNRTLQRKFFAQFCRGAGVGMSSPSSLMAEEVAISIYTILCYLAGDFFDEVPRADTCEFVEASPRADLIGLQCAFRAARDLFLQWVGDKGLNGMSEARKLVMFDEVLVRGEAALLFEGCEYHFRINPNSLVLSFIEHLRAVYRIDPLDTRAFLQWNSIAELNNAAEMRKYDLFSAFSVPSLIVRQGDIIRCLVCLGIIGIDEQSCDIPDLLPLCDLMRGIAQRKDFSGPANTLCRAKLSAALGAYPYVQNEIALTADQGAHDKPMVDAHVKSMLAAAPHTVTARSSGMRTENEPFEPRVPESRSRLSSVATIVRRRGLLEIAVLPEPPPMLRRNSNTRGSGSGLQFTPHPPARDEERDTGSFGGTSRARGSRPDPPPYTARQSGTTQDIAPNLPDEASFRRRQRSVADGTQLEREFALQYVEVLGREAFRDMIRSFFAPHPPSAGPQTTNHTPMVDRRDSE